MRRLWPFGGGAKKKEEIWPFTPKQIDLIKRPKPNTMVPLDESIGEIFTLFPCLTILFPMRPRRGQGR